MVRPGRMVWVGVGGERAVVVHLGAIPGNASGPVCHFHFGSGIHGAILWLWAGGAVHVQFGVGAGLFCVSAEAGGWGLGNRISATGYFRPNLGAGSGTGAAKVASGNAGRRSAATIGCNRDFVGGCNPELHGGWDGYQLESRSGIVVWIFCGGNHWQAAGGAGAHGPNGGTGATEPRGTDRQL